MKVPTEKCLEDEEVFQLKYAPPIIIDQVKDREVVIKTSFYLSMLLI